MQHWDTYTKSTGAALLPVQNQKLLRIHRMPNLRIILIVGKTCFKASFGMTAKKSKFIPHSNQDLVISYDEY